MRLHDMTEIETIRIISQAFDHTVPSDEKLNFRLLEYCE